MMQSTVFDSRQLRYKRPYGAVPSGTVVEFNLRPARADGYSRAVLKARFEFDGDRTEEIEMPWTGSCLGEDCFTGTLDTGGYVGLVWYSFTLERFRGSPLNLGEYQLTVYDGAEEVPGWFGEGMTYQIFPDRFHRLGVPDASGQIGGRTVHQDWAEEPEYLPNRRGEVRNRDFFGGSLAGITAKLDDLSRLGVETLYLNPIFEAAENHRYGTGDYEKIDPMLGTEDDFRTLCREAHRRGIRVVLDGVFNHTGFVSRYFNGDGSYPGKGAAQSRKSPYYSWYRFTHWPDVYECWWGIYSLPAVEENDPGYQDYIYAGENSIIRRWLRAGADGWRLDVADELPDFFVQGIHQAVREEKPDGVVIGEVWEDGSTKIAYGVRRKHILGGHCDGLMNYPFRNAALDYLLGGDAAKFMESMETLRENYPPFAWHSAMNSLGTHDTPRILTLLGVGSACPEQTRDWRAAYRMTPEQRDLGRRRLMAGAVLLMTFPGSPTLYYGDEAGLEGFEDPFNRRTYPWGSEDEELIRWFSALGRLRKRSPALRQGDIRYLAASGPLLSYARTRDSDTLITALNLSAQPVELTLPADCEVILGSGSLTAAEDGIAVRLPGYSGSVLRPRVPPADWEAQ